MWEDMSRGGMHTRRRRKKMTIRGRAYFCFLNIIATKPTFNASREEERKQFSTSCWWKKIVSCLMSVFWGNSFLPMYGTVTRFFPQNLAICLLLQRRPLCPSRLSCRLGTLSNSNLCSWKESCRGFFLLLLSLSFPNKNRLCSIDLRRGYDLLTKLRQWVSSFWQRTKNPTCRPKKTILKI